MKEAPVSSPVAKPSSTEIGAGIKHGETKQNNSSLFIQPKLTVSAPDDPYEKEADDVAEKVMRMPEQSFVPQLTAGNETIQREDDEETNTPNKNNDTDNLQQQSTEPDFLSLHTPFFDRNVPQLWDASSALGVWRYNFDFFKKFGLNENWAGKAANLTAPLFIDSQLKADNPKWWEITDRELNTSSIVGTLPLFNFDADFRNWKPLPFIQRKCATCEEEKIQKQAVDEDKELVQTKLNDNSVNVRRKCEECKKEEEKPLQTKPIISSIQTKTAQSSQPQTDIETSIEASKGNGNRMDMDTMSFMQSRFQTSFESVTIHSDSKASDMNRQLKAKAFTVGDNIFFNEGQYQPHTNEGKTLLAHELTHVVQQNKNVSRGIQRKPAGTHNTVQTYNEDSVILEDELLDQPAGGLYPGMLKRGYFKVELLHLPPEAVELMKPPSLKPIEIRNSDQLPDIESPEGPLYKLPPQPNPLGSKPGTSGKAIVVRVTRRIDIKTNRGVEAHIIMTAQTTLSKKFKITKTTPREIADELLNYVFGNARIQILFNTTFPNQMPDSADPVNESKVTSINDIIRTYASDLVGYDLPSQQQYDAAIKLLLANVPYSAIVLDDPDRKEKSREYKTLEEAKKAAAALGKKDILIVQSQDGKYHVHELTQMDLMRMADELRRNENSGQKIDWHTSPNKEKVEVLYLNGKEANLTDIVNNAYYVDTDAAAVGHGTDANTDAVVYKMFSSGFYARKPITHDEALAIWKTIDDKVEFSDHIDKAYSVPGGKFISLYVKGTGQFHTIDADYVEGKRIYFQGIKDYNTNGFIPTAKGNVSLFQYDLFQNTGSEKLRKYIDAQLDHGTGNDHPLRESLKGKDNLQREMSDYVLDSLDSQARVLAMDILAKTNEALKAMSGTDDSMRNLILSLPSLSSKDRMDVLSMMGVKEDYKPYFEKILADKQKASQIAFGVPVQGVSFQTLRSGMQTVIKDTDKLIQQINDFSILPLRIEGDFGNTIREKVYKDNGFTRIKANTYPHHDETNSFFPDPLEGNEYDFSGLKEQIYANKVANMDHQSFILKIAGVTLIAIVTAAIVVISGGVGAGVAAAFFEAGTASFVATEIVVGAATMTILGEGLNQVLGQGALGRDKDYYGLGELFKTFGENLLLSGIFAGVGRLMKNVASIWRLSATGTLFLGYSLGKYYYEHKKLPQGRDLYVFIYQNLITLAAIEAGSILARPLTQMFYAKGLDARVSSINARITELRLDITTSQKRLAEMVAAGKLNEAELLQHISEQRALLERQQKILIELRDAKEIKTDIDVNAELKNVEEALQKIRVVEFQSKVRFQQNRFAPEKISYKAGQASINEIIKFYGKENVTGPDEKGIIKVRTPDGGEVEFYPDTLEAEINKAILEKPAIKLAVTTEHSINIYWKNIDNIPGLKIFKGEEVITALDFWHEKGSTLYDIVYKGRYYVKYDTKNGRLLIGDTQKGEIIGFYLDDARNYPDLPHSDILVKNPLTDIPAAVEKLLLYHGLVEPTVPPTPLKGDFSSGAKIVATPDKTTTIVGAFTLKDGKITYTDMPQLFDNFGNLKNADFGAKPGGFNVLNVGEGFYEPGAFFENYNRPWLETAIARGDVFYTASDPMNEKFIYERNKVTGEWVYVDDPVTSQKVRKKTGFGKEVQILEEHGYKYDPTTKMYTK